MNEKATRMLFAAVALSAFAAVLASTANAYVPEGAGVPAETYTSSTSMTVLGEQQTQQASVRTKLGEIGAWTVPSISNQKPLSQQTSVREKLGEVGSWASPSSSHQKPLSQQTSGRQKLGEIGAWAVPSTAYQTQTPLATHPAIPAVDPSTFEGYRG